MPGKRLRLSADVRREQILEAATRLFIERGFANVQMGDIAEQVGTSRPNIYTHFPSVDALLDTLLQHQANAFIATMKQAISERKALSAPEAFELLLQHRELVLLLRSAGEPILYPHRRKVMDTLTAHMHDVLGSQVQPEQQEAFKVLMTMQHNLYLGTAYEVVSNPEGYDLDLLKQQLDAMLSAAYALALPQIHANWEQRRESTN